MQRIDDGDLKLLLQPEFLSAEEQSALVSSLQESIPWYRVKYTSERFGNKCETPCWTNYFGGIRGIEPHVPIPPFLQALSEKVAKACDSNPESGMMGTVSFNSVLVRLYLDGNDNIAWHTDGRTFLGPQPTIGSVSVGGTATFQMRRMLKLWQSIAGKSEGGSSSCSVDPTTPRRDFVLRSGALLVMRGETQQHWHHRVPTESGRSPRFNINFRRILPGQHDSARGVQTFYKYCVHGDCTMATAKRWTFREILQQRAPLLAMLGSSGDNGEKRGSRNSNTSSSGTSRVVCDQRKEGAGDQSKGASSTQAAKKRNHTLLRAFAEGQKQKQRRTTEASATKASIVGAAESSANVWTCTSCTFENTPTGRDGEEGPASSADLLWDCCELCDTPRPPSSSAGGKYQTYGA
jgi:alkylated DNA repair dioxygenase AlkB